jgi:hypothetical protein
MLNDPWIDPLTCEMEDVLDERSFHLVCLMGGDDDVFHLVDTATFVAVMHGDFSKYTSNYMSLSIEKNMVERVEDNKVYTKDIPRTKIAIDSIFVNLDDIADLRRKLSEDYFVFI